MRNQDPASQTEMVVNEVPGTEIGLNDKKA